MLPKEINLINQTKPRAYKSSAQSQLSAVADFQALCSVNTIQVSAMTAFGMYVPGWQGMYVCNESCRAFVVASLLRLMMDER